MDERKEVFSVARSTISGLRSGLSFNAAFDVAFRNSDIRGELKGQTKIAVGNLIDSWRHRKGNKSSPTAVSAGIIPVQEIMFDVHPLPD